MSPGNLWTRYVRFWSEREGPESLALLRITFAAALIANLLEQLFSGVVLELYALPEQGGIFRFDRPTDLLSLFRFLTPTATVVWTLFLLQLLGAITLLLGCWTRVSAIVCFVIQVTLYERMDRFVFGGDNVFRVFLFLMCLAPVGAAWSLDARRRRQPSESVPRWPRRLFIFQLTVVYVATGIIKMGSTWTILEGWSAGYLALNLPGLSRWPGDWAAHPLIYPLVQLGTALTSWWEKTFFLVPLNLWLRRRRQEGKKLGPVRRLLSCCDFRKGYLAFGILFHITLTTFFDLGLFSTVMVSLYPCLLHPEEARRILEWCAGKKPPPVATGGLADGG